MGSFRSVGEIVATTLNDLGLPAPTDIIQAVLLKDHHFVGYKYRWDGGCAILPAGGNTIEFYADDGKLLTSLTIEIDQLAAA